jgi:hypothetical protein
MRGKQMENEKMKQILKAAVGVVTVVGLLGATGTAMATGPFGASSAAFTPLAPSEMNSISHWLGRFVTNLDHLAADQATRTAVADLGIVSGPLTGSSTLNLKMLAFNHTPGTLQCLFLLNNITTGAEIASSSLTWNAGDVSGVKSTSLTLLGPASYNVTAFCGIPKTNVTPNPLTDPNGLHQAQIWNAWTEITP